MWGLIWERFSSFLALTKSTSMIEEEDENTKNTDTHRAMDTAMETDIKDKDKDEGTISKMTIVMVAVLMMTTLVMVMMRV